MGKVFEDYLAELQADMVAITLEYVFKKADKIYIYCSCEQGIFYFSFFYQIDGITLHRHKLKELNNGSLYDVSIERQKSTVDIGKEDLMKIGQLCEKYDREIPTEIKLIYDVKKNSLNASYSYDIKYSNTEDLTFIDTFNQWFEEVKKENRHELG